MTKAKKVVFKEDSLEAIKGLIINSQEGVVDLTLKDIALFLYDANELEVCSVTLNPFCENTLMSSGLITESAKNAKKCIVVITAGLDLTLDSVDLIMKMITKGTTAKRIKFASNCVESMENTVRIQLYAVK